ncbi:Fosmidomycin resistance protein [Candidatus Paraburkholderia calva]|nr:Fosmidomycin resistance protein [Candidatus Paraburkholderia calva]
MRVIQRLCLLLPVRNEFMEILSKQLTRSATSATRQGVTVVTLAAAHFANDAVQSAIVALYPVIRMEFGLSFTKIGLLAFIYQVLSSVCQPLIGWLADRYRHAGLLIIGMLITFVGVVALSFAPNYVLVVTAVALAGIGSAAFHPESSRLVRLNYGVRKGLFQAIYQVGGNLGTAAAPLFVAGVVLVYGRHGVAWLAAPVFFVMLFLVVVLDLHRRRGVGTSAQPAFPRVQAGTQRASLANGLSSKRRRALFVLLMIVCVKYIYMASLNAYYVFYLMQRFHLSLGTAQVHLTGFLLALGVGTLAGGLISDRFGRCNMIVMSMLATCPLSIALPYAGIEGTTVLTILIGLSIASTFSSIVVYAQDLYPARAGLISGIFFGLAAGVAGTAAAVIGAGSDSFGVVAVFHVCSFLPCLGLVARLLPKDLTGKMVQPRA